MLGHHRRSFLTGAIAASCVASLRPALASTGAARSLSLHNIHTDEHLAVDYWVEGTYQPEALSAINRVLRDFRTGDVHPIDPRLLDLLNRLHSRLAAQSPFLVISGYRSPATNAMLRAEHVNSGVAAKSLHMQGMAIDIRLADRSLSNLHAAALAEQGGGVGYYPQSDFVHVDVGRTRRW